MSEVESILLNWRKGKIALFNYIININLFLCQSLSLALILNFANIKKLFRNNLCTSYYRETHLIAN